MNAELTKLNTGEYNSDLDELVDNNTDVYLKAKLTKRLTYGEYVGEPNNGFELHICDERKLLDLDNVEVFTCEGKPSLTADQQVVLEWLKKKIDGYLDVSYLVGDLNYFAATPVGQAWKRLSKAEQFQVLAAFAEWGLSNA